MRRAQGAEGCRVVPRACEPENAAELAGFRPGRFLIGVRFCGKGVKKRNKTENMFLFLEAGLSMHSFFIHTALSSDLDRPGGRRDGRQFRHLCPVLADV